LHDIRKGTKIIKHASHKLFESYQRDAIFQREITNRPNTPSVENNMPTDPTRGQQPTLHDVLSAVPIFGYNDIMPITEFINDYREIQNAISPQEETNVVILLRGKLRGRARKALQAIIYYYKTIYGTFKNFIRNHGRYF